MTLLIPALLSCLTWVYLLAARGGFWRAACRDWPPSPMSAEQSAATLPHVCVIIPARNEAETIGTSAA